MHVSSSEHCERTILSTVSILQRVRSMKSNSLAMLKVDKACIWETLQTLCEEDCFVADAAVLRLPGILSLPGITLPSIEMP